MGKPKLKLKFKHGFVIAIDGPAGAGKSTVSRQLAVALGGVLLDTGAMYRGVAYYAVKEGKKTAKDLSAIAKRLHFDVDRSDGHTLLVNKENLGTKLRTETVSAMASSVSRFKGVRLSLTRRQRAIGRELSKKLPVVMEGRDIGTVVFPKAMFKFYVTASPEVRAERRLSQLKKQGMQGASLKEVLKQQEARDDQDSTRKLAPLRCSEDAVVVDTSSMGITQVVRFMAGHIRNYFDLTEST
jgi:cytidylate kinase